MGNNKLKACCVAVADRILPIIIMRRTKRTEEKKEGEGSSL